MKMMNLPILVGLNGRTDLRNKPLKSLFFISVKAGGWSTKEKEDKEDKEEKKKRKKKKKKKKKKEKIKKKK